MRSSKYLLETIHAGLRQGIEYSTAIVINNKYGQIGFAGIYKCRYIVQKGDITHNCIRAFILFRDAKCAGDIAIYPRQTPIREGMNARTRFSEGFNVAHRTAAAHEEGGPFRNICRNRRNYRLLGPVQMERVRCRFGAVTPEFQPPWVEGGRASRDGGKDIGCAAFGIHRHRPGIDDDHVVALFDQSCDAPRESRATNDDNFIGL